MNYIRITRDNIDKEHICCAMSGKQSLAKKEWLKQRFDEGLVFLRSTERGKCFIEYIPAENAWVPIVDATGWIYIDCLWVSGALKGHGYAGELLAECIRDAKAQSRKGLCIVGASICAVSALCILTEAQGGCVFGLFGEPIDLFEQVADLEQAGIELIAATIQLTADAVLFGLAQSYLKAEQADGTPFAEQGASRLKALGIRCIWIPIVAIVIAEVIAVSQGMSDAGEIGKYSEVITGIVLILVSMIFSYGAELEQKPQIAEQ